MTQTGLYRYDKNTIKMFLFKNRPRVEVWAAQNKSRTQMTRNIQRMTHVFVLRLPAWRPFASCSLRHSSNNSLSRLATDRRPVASMPMPLPAGLGLHRPSPRMSCKAESKHKAPHLKSANLFDRGKKHDLKSSCSKRWTRNRSSKGT